MDLDQEARKRIVEGLDKNYFVEASAGSGKTTSLVYRMVALVEHGVSVDKICTITFTKAAANEFFERFQKYLSIRSGDEPDSIDELLGERTDESKRLCQKALRNIDLCFLGTIDSFCNIIAHEMPAELKIPASSSVISDAEYSQIVKEKYNEILKMPEHKLYDLAVKFNRFVNDPFEAFVEGISSINDFRNLKVEYDPSISEKEFDEYYDAKDKKNIMEILKNLISPNEDDLYDISKSSGKDRSKAKDDIAKDYKGLLLNIHNWADRLFELGDALKKTLKMDGFKEEALQTTLGDYLDDSSTSGTYWFNDDFKNDIQLYRNKINDYVYSLYFRFILSVLDEVTNSLKEQGKFQFFDFLLYLRNAFRDSALGDRVLIDHIMARHSYFMLDESQDTNPLQTEMFFYLTSTVQNNDWKKVCPKESSLFIVGDPKQSIYGFRGADVKAYLDNKKIFKDKDELLVLTKNFRSHAHLREWFNASFNDMLNYTDPLFKEFALEHLDIPIDEDDESLTISLDDSTLIEGAYRYPVTNKKTEDCDDVARLILDIKKNRKIYRTKFNPETKKIKIELDSIKYKDFLVVPHKADMIAFVSAFSKYNIPLIVEGRVDFNSSESFKVVTKLISLVKDPLNKAAFIDVMFSKLYNFNDSDIIQMINDGFDLNIANPELDSIEFTNQEHKDTILSLNSLYNQTLEMSFSSTIQYILNDSNINIFSKVNSKDLEYIYYFVEKTKEGEESGSISSLKQFQDYIDNFVFGGDEQRTLRFSDKVDRVKIANLHKVKGLQAPIVILARPNFVKRAVKKYIDYTIDPPTIKIASVSPSDTSLRYNYAETSRFISEKDKWDASAKAERDRLAYVGATRAEAALIVCEKTSGNTEGYWDELVNRINRTLSVPNIQIPDPVYEEVALGDYHINEDSHKQSFDYISPSQSRSSSKNTNKDEIDDSIYEETEDSSNSTIKGTIVHKLMECIISSKNSYNIDKLIKTILSDYGYSKEYDEMLHNIASKILNGGFPQVNSSLDKDILKTLLEAKKVWCEVPFSYQSDKGNIVHGIIDCMYLDKNDKYHVIDYKTNKENDVSELEKHYDGQLKHYYYALKKMGIEADTHIYHIDLDK